MTTISVGVPVSFELVYVYPMPTRNVVLHSPYFNNGPPIRYSGNLDMFIQSASWKMPVVIDPLTAISISWITPRELLDDMPWLDQKIQAALRLVL